MQRRKGYKQTQNKWTHRKNIMGKKKSSEGQVSNGERRNVSSWSRKAGRNSISGLENLSNKVAAWKQGKKVFLTITNPIKGEKSKPFVRKEAKEIWGKYSPYSMKQTH
jgi:hypothetical protein